MSRKTIAPTLAYVLDQRESADLEPEALRLGREARRELRALLAVARAAERDLSRLADDLCVTREELNAAEDATGDLARALARLSRASRQGGER